jgi:hypothetical protein
MLKIQANPTFNARVEIPTPEGPVAIKMVFKHMDTEAYNDFIKREAELQRSNEDAIMDIAEGWHEVDGEFNRENVAKVCKQYHAAAGVIVTTFINELTQAKAGNFAR